MRIGIDLDDVLADFTPGLIAYHNEVYGTDFNLSDCRQYTHDKLWGVDIEEAVRRVVAFSHEYLLGLHPTPGAKQAVDYLNKDHTLHIITARNEIFSDLTSQWIDIHFQGKFEGIHFVSHYTDKHREKGDVCKELRIDMMIDDSFDNALSCAPVCESVFLFDKPWNAEYVLADNMKRVFTWDNVMQEIRSLVS